MITLEGQDHPSDKNIQCWDCYQ